MERLCKVSVPYGANHKVNLIKLTYRQYGEKVSVPYGANRLRNTIIISHFLNNVNFTKSKIIINATVLCAFSHMRRNAVSFCVGIMLMGVLRVSCRGCVYHYFLNCPYCSVPVLKKRVDHGFCGKFRTSSYVNTVSSLC